MPSNGEKLKAWRTLQGMSQAEAAEKFGVPQGTWAPWETCKKAPDRENAPALETFTGGAVAAKDWPARKRRHRASVPRTGTDG